MILYHASQHKDLTTITPQRTLSHDQYIGDFVFATANRTLAIMYLVPKGFAILMNPDGDRPTIVIAASAKDFKKCDAGGAVYELPDDNFKKTPQEGLSDFEMVSTHAVEPLHAEVFENTLDALVAAGVVVKFVNDEKFKMLIKNPNQKQLIEELESYHS